MARFIHLDVPDFESPKPELLVPAAQIWVGWNKLIAARVPEFVVKIEEARKLLPGILGLLRLQTPRVPAVEITAASKNARIHPGYSWSVLKAQLPAGLYAEVVAVAAGLGYPEGRA
jgi:hypothetical protein